MTFWTCRYLQSSWIYHSFLQITSFFHRIAEKSLISNGFRLFTAYCRLTLANSSFLHFFTSDRTLLDEAFKDNYLGKILNRFVLSFSRQLYTLIYHALNESFLHRQLKTIRQDIKERSIRNLAFFFFAFLSIRVSLELAFGKGYHRDEIFIYFLLLAICWFITYTSIPLRWFYDQSRLLNFIKGLFS